MGAGRGRAQAWRRRAHPEVGFWAPNRSGLKPSIFPGGLEWRSSTQHLGFVSRITRFNKIGFFYLKGKAESEPIFSDLIGSLSLRMIDD